MKQSQVALDRREFVKRSSALVAGAVLSAGPISTLIADAPKKEGEAAGKGRIYKTVKWGMIATGGSVLEKFRLMKELGYDGMELVSPWKRDIKEVRQAIDETGMPVHALVD